MNKVILDEDLQTHVTLTPETIQQFIRQKKSDALMAALEPLSTESKAHILATNNVAFFLATCGHGARVQQILGLFRNDRTFEILNSGNALDGLLRTCNAEAILLLIMKLQPNHQAELLSKPYVIARYFVSTEARALQIVELIAKLPPEQQTQVLSTHNVVNALAKKGMAMDVFGLISKLSPYERDRIAVAKGYQEVSNYCIRRSAERQTPVHLDVIAQSPPVNLMATALTAVK